MKLISLVLVFTMGLVYSATSFSQSCVNGCCRSDDGKERFLDPRVYGDDAQVDTGLF